VGEGKREEKEEAKTYISFPIKAKLDEKDREYRRREEEE
jgi:hypothetical protein